MSYILPSVLVYQQLASSSGVANTTPDLEACIIGPCYNVIEYDGSSAAALTLSAAVGANGDAFAISNPNINNVCYLPSQKTGQVLEETSLEVYVNNAYVETFASEFTGAPGSNELDFGTYSATGSMANGSAIVTSVSATAGVIAGDYVIVAGAGVNGTDLTAKVLEVDSNSLILSLVARSGVTNAAISKAILPNVNPATATKRVAPGDAVVVEYVTLNDGPKTFPSTVYSVIDETGTLQTLHLADILPANVVAGSVVVRVRRKFNNQLLAADNYDMTAAAATGAITILPAPEVAYGLVVSGEVHIGYRALRTDLSGAIQAIATADDIVGVLGAPSDRNPLALGVQLAMANTITQVNAVAVASDNLLGYQDAMGLIEDAKMYGIVPLTTDIDVLTAFQQHVEQSSVPEVARWRGLYCSTAIPTEQNVGIYNANLVNANSGNNAITLVNGRYILTSSNATFVSDGMIPGDVIHVTQATGSPSQVGALKVLAVLNNQQIQLQATGTATAVSYYATRKLTKAQQAAHVAGVSKTFGSSRVSHCPNTAGVAVNGVTKYLPGYYFMCGVVGLVAGLPAQAGLTNIALAGFVDVQFSNFYFTRPQLNSMAAEGTFLVVQESQGSIPYIRHELTTDMTVLQYREIQQVKNIDYLSYFFTDVLKGFIGKWNITEENLNVLRTQIEAGCALLKGKTMPRVGPPLVGYTIERLAQDPNNKDHVIAKMPVQIPTVMNYIDLYLVY